MTRLYFDRCEPRRFNAENGGRVIHFAPEKELRDAVLSQSPAFYVTTDYDSPTERHFPDPALQCDMQHMPIRDDSFDCALCVHVLEHVMDDRKGIGEIRRVLKPGGVAYLMVPFMMGWEKTVEFGKPDPLAFDHFRGYSVNDFGERLAGFEYQAIYPGVLLSAQELFRYGIPPDSQVIYRCVKPRL